MKLGFIGAGNMAGAIIDVYKRQGNDDVMLSIIKRTNTTAKVETAATI